MSPTVSSILPHAVAGLRSEMMARLHWSDDRVLLDDSPFAGERRLTDLVCEVSEAIGTRFGVVKSMTVCHGFVAIERGDAVIDSESFNLDAQILRRPSL